jgi:hypothetical protein
MNTQPDVNPEEDALEQMLLLEVYVLRHFVTGLQVFRLMPCSAQDHTTSLGSVFRSEDRMERKIRTSGTTFREPAHPAAMPRHHFLSGQDYRQIQQQESRP